MAIFRPGGVAGSVSGALGGQVYVNSRSGPVIRRRGVRSGGPSIAAVAARGMPGRVAAAWQALTDAQRDAWRTAAAGLRFPNRLGVMRAITGYQLYASYVMDVYLGSAPASLTPPAASSIYQPAGVTAYFIEGGPYAVTSRGLPLFGLTPTEYVYCQRGRAVGQNTGFNRYVRVGSWLHPFGSYDAYDECAAAGCDMFDGERFAIGDSWQTSGGYLSPRVWAPSTVGGLPFVSADFENGTIAPFETAGGTWAVNTTNPRSGTYSLQYTVAPGPVVQGQIISFAGLPVYPCRGHVFDWWGTWATGAASVRMWFGAQGTTNNYAALFASGGNLTILKLVSAVQTSVCVTTLPALTNGAWYRCRVSWGYAGTMSITLFDSGGTQLGTASGTDTTYNVGAIGFRAVNVASSGFTSYFDDVEIVGRAA